MKFCVTGAAGFIGSNLAESLLHAGHQVSGLDDLSTGLHTNVDRLTALGGTAFTFAKGDVRDASVVAHCLEGVDVAVHLAAQPSVQLSFEKPGDTNAINVTGFLHVLEAATSQGIPLIYASSCALYGDTTNLPISESEPPRPLSPYAASKRADELYADALLPRFPKAQIIGLRFFNIFGPWQNPQGAYAAVIPRWIAAAIHGTPPIIFGEGDATRDFCYVGNVCQLITQLGHAPGPAGHHLYNVGSGSTIALNALWNTIKAVVTEVTGTEVTVPPEHQPWRAGDIRHSAANIAHIVAERSFSCPTDLRAGIAAIIATQYS